MAPSNSENGWYGTRHLIDRTLYRMLQAPSTPYRAELADDREIFYCPVAGNEAIRKQGEVEQASAVPPRYWVDATDELLLTEPSSSLITVAERLYAHR